MAIDNLMQRGRLPGPQSDAAVSLRGVTRLFDGLPAISQITLDLAAGETVWLRGSNGSGQVHAAESRRHGPFTDLRVGHDPRPRPGHRACADPAA